MPDGVLLQLRAGGVPLPPSVGRRGGQPSLREQAVPSDLFRFLGKQPLADTLDQLQAQVDQFDIVYNTHRPHQDLPGRTTPQRAWEATPVAIPPRPATPHAPLPGPGEDIRIKVVRRGGRRLLALDRRNGVSTSFASSTVSSPSHAKRRLRGYILRRRARSPHAADLRERTDDNAVPASSTARIRSGKAPALS